ncbi:uncharacterized protein [Nicotiana tomentosiformis]|uniref:uncharacterized protein n=1 Tax=Nicotiana tomentosiformis TaxID=4098 RepID=UPI00388C7DA9
MSRPVHSALPASSGAPVASRSQVAHHALPLFSAPHVWDSIVVDLVYRSYLVVISGFETRVDLLLLVMVNFDVILAMDWLSPYHVILDCHAKTVTLAMPGLPRLEWQGTLDYVPRRVVSFLKEHQMVEKGCDAYLTFVRDVSINTFIVKTVLVVRDFPDVFPSDHPGMSSDRDDFCIDLLLVTQPIFIPPYCMPPAELNE